MFSSYKDVLLASAALLGVIGPVPTGNVLAQLPPIFPVDNRNPNPELIPTTSTQNYPGVELDSIPACIPQASPTSCKCPKCRSRQVQMNSKKYDRVARKQSTYWGYDANSIVQPLGSSVSNAMSAQAYQGTLENSTLYYYDFYPAQSQHESFLNPYGQDRLRAIVARACKVGAPIQIQATLDNPSLDEQRKQCTLDFANSENLGLAPDAVIMVRSPRTTVALEAQLMLRNRLNSVQSMGRYSSGGASNSAGAGASGIGGAANSGTAPTGTE
jgi:hypothetical protein